MSKTPVQGISIWLPHIGHGFQRITKKLIRSPGASHLPKTGRVQIPRTIQATTGFPEPSHPEAQVGTQSQQTQNRSGTTRKAATSRQSRGFTPGKNEKLTWKDKEKRLEDVSSGFRRMPLAHRLFAVKTKIDKRPMVLDGQTSAMKT